MDASLERCAWHTQLGPRTGLGMSLDLSGLIKVARNNLQHDPKEIKMTTNWPKEAMTAVRACWFMSPSVCRSCEVECRRDVTKMYTFLCPALGLAPAILWQIKDQQISLLAPWCNLKLEREAKGQKPWLEKRIVGRGNTVKSGWMRWPTCFNTFVLIILSWLKLPVT